MNFVIVSFGCGLSSTIILLMLICTLPPNDGILATKILYNRLSPDLFELQTFMNVFGDLALVTMSVSVRTDWIASSIRS